MLYDFFLRNLSEIYFVYGLSFFLMGFAISLQVRRNSSFTMARSLWLLATFGFLHGISEWFFFYIPHKAALTNPVFEYSLRLVELNLIGISFAFLLFFGIRLLDDVLVNKNLKPLLYLSLALAGVWFLYFTVYRLFIVGENVEYWFTVGDIYSRHFFGLPGGLLSAYAVYRQRDQIKLFGGKPSVLFSLNILVFSFALYAIVAGLIVPPAPVFFAEFINTENFFRWLGVPGPFFRMLACIVITISMLRVLTLFREEKISLIKRVVCENAVLMERERIKKDLHDGIIQSMYAVGLHVKDVDYLLGEGAYEEAKERVASAMENCDHIITDLRSYIQDLKRVELAGLNITQLIEELKTLFKMESSMPIDVDNRLEKDMTISADAKVQLYHILREILNNAVKYSQAQKVRVKLYARGKNLVVLIQDDGKGFGLNDLKEKQDRREKMGLLHVKERIESIKGSFQIISSKGQGTKITLELPTEGEE